MHTEVPAQDVLSDVQGGVIATDVDVRALRSLVVHAPFGDIQPEEPQHLIVDFQVDRQIGRSPGRVRPDLRFITDRNAKVLERAERCHLRSSPAVQRSPVRLPSAFASTGQQSYDVMATVV